MRAYRSGLLHVEELLLFWKASAHRKKCSVEFLSEQKRAVRESSDFLSFVYAGQTKNTLYRFCTHTVLYRATRWRWRRSDSCTGRREIPFPSVSSDPVVWFFRSSNRQLWYFFSSEVTFVPPCLYCMRTHEGMGKSFFDIICFCWVFCLSSVAKNKTSKSKYLGSWNFEIVKWNWNCIWNYIFNIFQLNCDASSCTCGDWRGNELSYGHKTWLHRLS